MNLTEMNSWQLLHDFANARIARKGIKQSKFEELGGPAPSTFRALKTYEGLPTTRQANTLAQVDILCGWREGTSWDLVSEDHSETPLVFLEDIKARLVEAPDARPPLSALERRIANFMGIVASRLRDMTEAEADAAMLAIYELVGAPAPSERGD